MDVEKVLKCQKPDAGGSFVIDESRMLESGLSGSNARARASQGRKEVLTHTCLPPRSHHAVLQLR